MNRTTPAIYTPTYVEMKRPLSTSEAALLLAGFTPSEWTRESKKHPQVKKLQKHIQDACKLFENEKFTDEYRDKYGLPSAWDGGCRVIEQFQAKKWHSERYTKTKQPRYKIPKYKVPQ